MFDSRTVIVTHETPAHRLTLMGDGIVHVYSKPSHINVEDILNLSEAYAKIRNGGKKLKVILDPTEENSMSDEARKAVQREMRKNCYCIAVIARKRHIRILGNFFLKMKDVGFKFKLFANEEEAKAWIDSIDVE